MMSIHSRLEHLERQHSKEGPLTLEQAFERYCRLLTWLEERGYADALAAVEAGETGPVGLENLLRDQAGYDHKHRAFARIEKALEARELPEDADLRALRC